MYISTVTVCEPRFRVAAVTRDTKGACSFGYEASAGWSWRSWWCRRLFVFGRLVVLRRRGYSLTR
jgi:hypothetical protein